MQNALIIDDEEDACKNISYLLQTHFSSLIHILPPVHSAAAAELSMAANSIQLFFVDIDMPVESGISFVRRNANKMKSVVFVTAYDEYAIDAFKLHAMDYILKPIDEDAFVHSVQHILDHHLARLPHEFDDLASHINSGESLDIMVLRDKQEATRIKINDILYIEAEKAYSKIVYRSPKGNKVFFASHNLSHYEDMLEIHSFIRVHKSYLVNQSLITKFNFRESFVVIAGNCQLPVSRRKRAGLLKVI
jgi:two-component system LytT family response regulator